VTWRRGGGSRHRWRRAVAVGLEILTHFFHHFRVDGLGHILSQQVDDEEVTEVALADQRWDVVGVVQRLVLAFDDSLADVGHEDDCCAQDDGHCCRHCQDDEPEPEEDVDLFVQDVEGKDAQGVVSLNRT
jgi:hypothetical protein